MNSQLYQKYNVPIPRYTSYPTVPNWIDNIDIAQWQNAFKEKYHQYNKSKGISIYLHLPFCESLCTYCGCNKKITSNHSVESEYTEAVLKEWKMYLSLMEEPPVIKELHIGGGTPTFFSSTNLRRLISTILNDAVIHDDYCFSIEGHPNNTSKEHLDSLYSLGFKRISYGVQDLDPLVQKTINRIQPFENVQKVTAEARAAGYTSVNFDLIYGLPHQTPASMENTLLQCIRLRPDRVAFYSYAHVPWTSRGQRLFDESDLPSAEEKIELYSLGKKIFTEAGYDDIGMDHFALPGDELFTSYKNGRLHRNFMGYTPHESALLLGLGVSSISDLGNAYAQNDKTLHNYYKFIEDGIFAINKGYFLNEEDLLFKRYILDISCKGKTSFQPEFKQLLEDYTLPQLKNLAHDALVTLNDNGTALTGLGKNFMRNVCAAFDIYLQKASKTSDRQVFSQAI